MSTAAEWPVPQAPTFYFIGVTTGHSSAMVLFPRWMQALGRPEVTIQGVDFVPHDRPARYRSLVEHIKREPLALGGLVTTHKIDLLEAARDLFDRLGPYAALLGEVSSIAKEDGQLVGRATDPVAGGIALRAVLGDGYFGRTGGHLLCFGAGGSAAALALYLIRQEKPDDRPRRFVVVNRSQPRLDRLRSLVERLQTDIQFEYICNQDPWRNDEIMAALPDGSVVINATGMGKDRPGSPITDAGRFPFRGVAWELNYRGELNFLHQALAQQKARQLTVEDGWLYFLHGWSLVIGHVLHREIDPATFDQLAAIAGAVAPRTGLGARTERS